nr:TATA-binding protein-associated factor BTAF1 [Tanacetum cinerariifolium]
MLGQHPLAVWSIAADCLVNDRYPGVRSVCNIGPWPNVRVVYGPVFSFVFGDGDPNEGTEEQRFDGKSVAERLRDVTGNSENVAVLQSTSDRYGHLVSRGINRKPDRNNTASCADDSRKHQDIQRAWMSELLVKKLHVTVTVLGVATTIWMYELLAKLNPIIPTLMASVQSEQDEALQTMEALYL